MPLLAAKGVLASTTTEFGSRRVSTSYARAINADVSLGEDCGAVAIRVASERRSQFGHAAHVSTPRDAFRDLARVGSVVAEIIMCNNRILGRVRCCTLCCRSTFAVIIASGPTVDLTRIP